MMQSPTSSLFSQACKIRMLTMMILKSIIMLASLNVQKMKIACILLHYRIRANKAIKDHPQKAVGWTRKGTRVLYSGVMH